MHNKNMLKAIIVASKGRETRCISGYKRTGGICFTILHKDIDEQSGISANIYKK